MATRKLIENYQSKVAVIEKTPERKPALLVENAIREGESFVVVDEKLPSRDELLRRVLTGPSKRVRGAKTLSQIPKRLKSGKKRSFSGFAYERLSVLSAKDCCKQCSGKVSRAVYPGD
jgi:hypothetical protein